MSENRNLVNPLNICCSLKYVFIKKHNPHETTSLKFFQPEIFIKLKRILYMLYHLVLFTI